VSIGHNGTTGNTVSGNYIGTDVSGTAVISNTGVGVRIHNGAHNNLIGGSTPGERNLISGNGDGGVLSINGTANTVSGNYIGTDVSGTAALGNGRDGVYIYDAAYNRIGGSTPGERNLISGNGGDGVGIDGTDTMSNTVSGNYIGTNISGTAAISNTGNGVLIIDGAQNNLIGGSTAGQRNLISGNGDRGVSIDGNGATGNIVSGNYIGTNVSGTAAISNTWQGVWIGGGAQNNQIGGSTPGERNLLSGNNDGVVIYGVGTMSNTVSGNTIGTDVSGALAIGNVSQGVAIAYGAQFNLIGGSTITTGNVIVHSGAHGIFVVGVDAVQNTLSHNSIYSNADKGIMLSDGGNTELAAPVIASIAGNTITGTACAGCIVEIFSDDADEGHTFEGSTTAEGSGHFSFSKPGGFTRLNVTATATDVSGNTSEFSAPMPTVLPSISQLMPNQGTNNVPNEINIYGLNFASGITASLGTTPPISLTVQFIANTQLRAVVPVSLPAGIFDLTVVNPGGGRGTLANAYTVFGAANDDLFGYSYELWTDPQMLRAGEQGGVGLVVHRQGGTSTLSNVIVRFYQGAPTQGGTIGDGVIALLSPDSLQSTPKVNWTPPDAGTYDLYAVIDPGNAITETIESNNTVSRTTTVLGPAPDQVAPHVDSFAINDGASSTNSLDVTLDAAASDNPGGSGVASLLYLEFEYSQGAGQWIPVQNSGWVTYTTAYSNYSWHLLPVAGMRYMQAWAADKAGNISLYPSPAYINYIPPTDHVEQGQVRVYRRNVVTGTVLTVQVTPFSGDPDLYVWPPDFPNHSPWVSDQSSGVDEVSFTAPVSGVYQIEVEGYTTADYQISIGVTPAGSNQPLAARGIDSKPLRSSPVVPVSSEPGGQIALPPVIPRQYRIYLPVIVRNL
jgi:hypothetical protein